jgi:hypothetical protein
MFVLVFPVRPLRAVAALVAGFGYERDTTGTRR